jgi:hypothetical protein
VHRAAHLGTDSLSLEYVEFLFAGAEAVSAGDLVAVHDGTDDEYALVNFETGFVHGVEGGLGHDHLVRLTVDHDLPTALTDVLAVFIGPDGQAPFFEQMHGRVDVAGDVEDQVVTGDAHQVLADVANVVFASVLVVAVANILVDGGKAHGHGAGAGGHSLVNQGNLQAIFLGPVGSLYSGATGAHAAAADQEVRIDDYGFPIFHYMSS